METTTKSAYALKQEFKQTGDRQAYTRALHIRSLELQIAAKEAMLKELEEEIKSLEEGK